MKPFLEALDERVLIGDGATGTMLYAKGIFLNRCFDDLNLTQPDLVAEIHQAYVRAGADVVETNTFGANRVKLATFGLESRLHAINAQGAKIARQSYGISAITITRPRPGAFDDDDFGRMWIVRHTVDGTARSPDDAIPHIDRRTAAASRDSYRQDLRFRRDARDAFSIVRAGSNDAR